MADTSQRAIHVVIPDTQVRPGVSTDHLDWIGRYIAEKFAGRPNVTLIHLGDHHDMPSLSSYDKKGGKRMEGRRYDADVEAGNTAWARLCRPIERAEARLARKGTPWVPRKIKLLGNHEHRIVRAAEQDAVLDGTLTLNDLEARGWDVYPFLEVVNLDGVLYSHFFANPSTGKPYGGMIETRIKNVGSSFTMGHQQDFKYGEVPFSWGRRIGMVAGSCYLHDEAYRGPQGNREWRGIVVCYGVNNGEYDLKKVSLDSLCHKYEGVSLREFVPGIGTGRNAV